MTSSRKAENGATLNEIEYEGTSDRETEEILACYHPECTETRRGKEALHHHFTEDHDILKYTCRICRTNSEKNAKDGESPSRYFISNCAEDTWNHIDQYHNRSIETQGTAKQAAADGYWKKIGRSIEFDYGEEWERVWFKLKLSDSQKTDLVDYLTLRVPTREMVQFKKRLFSKWAR